jgi:ribosome-associated translation inhibitor RaiA
MPTTHLLNVSFRRGRIPEHLIAYAHDRFERMEHVLPGPVLFGRLVLDVDPDPAVERRASAKINLDLNGQLVRAHVAAPTVREAIDMLFEKLRREVRALSEVWLVRRTHTGVSGPHGWRHGDLPTPRPAYFPRPVEDRTLVRRKTYALQTMSTGEALFEMDLLDYDWHLFVEAETRADAVVERAGGGLRLWLAGARVPKRFGVVEPVEVMTGVPRQAVSDATAVLDETNAPWHFFVDDASGRGAVVYRRYDGHYGLVTSTHAHVLGAGRQG